MVKLGEKILLLVTHEGDVEGDAIKQLQDVACQESVKKIVANPDLHPGKGIAIGSTVLSQNHIFPYLIGNDIGCAMLFGRINKKYSKLKIAKIIKKLEQFSQLPNELPDGWEKDRFIDSLGSLGGGNHFAELQRVEEIVDPELFAYYQLDKSLTYLLVHTGSRGLGEYILRKHTAKFRSASLLANSVEGQSYLQEHDYAIKWSRLNRELIAKKFSSLMGAEFTKLLDLVHNSIEFNPRLNGYLHRKGVSPSDKGLVIIPGSRGHYSYLVQPTLEQEQNLFSIAHGAGRKWKRGEVKNRLSGKYSVEQLQKTDLGNFVICQDKDLLYQEAPFAYRNIEFVINELLSHGLIKVVARMRPLLTYKR